MAHIVAQINIERDSGVPTDRTVNVLHFEGLGDFANPAAVGPILDKVQAFYTTPAPPQVSAVGALLASTVATTGHQIRLYDMAQPKPRAPLAIRDFTLAPGATAYPAEIAACLSFRGATLSGRDPSRRRGRIYIGPLIVNGTIDGADVRLPPAVYNILLDAGLRLRMANVPFSPTSPEGSIWVIEGLAAGVPKPAPPGPQPKQLVPVEHLWCDNAYDIQRRRGARATARFVRNP